MAALRALCARGSDAATAGDLPPLIRLNTEFHTAVTTLSANVVLRELCVQICRRVRWYYAPVALQRSRDSWQEHTALVDAIEAGDAERAGKIMETHLGLTRDLYLSRLAEAGTVPAAGVRRRRRSRRAITEPVKLTQMSSTEPSGET
jgi:DNA-binding GntR family transcriptional regulator